MTVIFSGKSLSQANNNITANNNNNNDKNNNYIFKKERNNIKNGISTVTLTTIRKLTMQTDKYSYRSGSNCIRLVHSIASLHLQRAGRKITLSGLGAQAEAVEFGKCDILHKYN